jgi:hypothetical protein
LGYAEASNVLAGSTFMGQTITLPAVLVRCVYPGDANLDGSVNSLDFNALAGHFNASNQNWDSGEFNYNSVVNALDFNALASTFGQTLPGTALPLGAMLAPNLFGEQPIADPLTGVI